MDIKNIYGWFSADSASNHIKNLSENKLLNIANDINAVMEGGNNQMRLPQLVVVGTQSSGKSSILNSIITMDILPTGKNMVTRTPLDIRLHKTAKKSSIKIISEIPITSPIPLESEVSKVREQIEKKTIDIAGKGSNIGTEPIIVDVYSPYVPNLSLIDLPGITMVACLDKGQPENIREQIESLIVKYINMDNSIVLAVMQSRTDLETDLGLALIKKIGNGIESRTIGILTKPDLMNGDNNVGDYLLGNISSSLKLGLGYYVVKNRSSIEMNTDIIKYMEIEKEYFKGHPEYSKGIYKNNIGTKILTESLNKTLIEGIRRKLPKALEELNRIENEVSTKLGLLGNEIPNDKEGQMLFLNKYVSSFYYKMMDSIDSKSMQLNSGKLIKDRFIKYRDEVMEINPFCSDVYSREYFEGVISNFEGNHMSFSIPPIQILEACIGDIELKPLMMLFNPSSECVDDICKILEDLVEVVRGADGVSGCSDLSSYISVCISEFVLDMKVIVRKRIIDKIKDEESYVWTDDKKFKESLVKGGGDKDIERIIEMLSLYYDSVKYVVCHDVPKIIMNGIVREIEKSLLVYLIKRVVREDKLGLLKEDDDIEEQRKHYGGIYNRILKIKEVLGEC